MSESRTAVSAGYMPLDIIDAETEVWQRAGGTAGNVAAILGLLGWHSRLAGRVGDDRAGRTLLSDLRASWVDCELVDVDEGALTNRIVHQVRPQGHRYLYSCPSCGQALPRSRPLRLDQVDWVLEICPKPDVYFFDRANAATVLLAEQYAETGVTVVFEPSTPANAELIQRAIRAASIVKGSDEHGHELVESYDSGRSDQLRVITEGARGARVRLGGGRWRRVGVFKVDVVDAAGAGDWTTAGVLHRIGGAGSVTVDEVAEAVEFGHALAALNCRLPGARALAEGRSRASVMAMVGNLRRGRKVEPTAPRPSFRSEVDAGGCDWCLLDRRPQKPLLRATATG
jgi:fructokinase